MKILIKNQKLDRALPLMLTPCWTEAENVQASVRLSWQENRLFVAFSVCEPQLRRMVQEHNQRVWEDSCVEVFLKREDSDEYINVECSASGSLLIAKGSQRSGRKPFDHSVVESVPVKITILENNNKQSRWKAELELDLIMLTILKEEESLPEISLFGNCYCCGDLLDEPHYLCASEIGTLKPDFHTPEYFVPLEFA